MRHLLTYATAISIMWGCHSPKSEQLPLGSDKVVDILADMRVVDEILDKYPAEEKDSVGELFMDSLFSIHSIDSLKFMEIMEYLHNNTRSYHEVEQKVHLKLKEYLDLLPEK